MAIKNTDYIDDMVTSTLRHLPPPRFSQIAQSLQDYEVLPKWLKKDKVSFDGGRGIREFLMVKTAGNAKHGGLHEKDDVNFADHLAELNIQWVRATTHWAWEVREVLENKGKALILKIIDPRRAGALIDMADLLEEGAWSVPKSSTDTNAPMGLPYWVVANSSTGFNGGVPSGHTYVGGIDPAVHTGFKNYTAQYTLASKADLVEKMRRACLLTKWKSPISVPGAKDFNTRRRIYCNVNTYMKFTTLGEAQNDNLGRDIASMEGTIMFNKHPIIYVPYLDSDSTDPVFMIDHSTFYPVVLKGDYLRETGPDKVADYHNSRVIHIDLSYNYLCVDRRRNARIQKA